MEEAIYYNNSNYPESELTGKLIGLAFEMGNRLVYGFQEKYFQRAYAALLLRHKLPFRREQKVVINFENKKIGRYFIDFVVADKVVVEFKVANDFHPLHIKQVLAYLKATSLPVGLLLLITQKGIRIKRLVNSNQRNQ